MRLILSRERGGVIAGIIRLEPSVATKTPLLSVEMDRSSNGDEPDKRKSDGK